MMGNLGRAVAILLFSLLATARTSHADPPAPKDESTAVAMSTLGVLASGGLIAAAFAVPRGHGDLQGALATAGVTSTLVTPSLGHWYAGSYLTTGLTLRLAGIAFGAAGVSQLGICFDDSGCHANNEGAGTLLAIGGATYITGILWDLATARSAARRYNREHAPAVRTAIAPTLAREGRVTSYGLALAGQF